MGFQAIPRACHQNADAPPWDFTRKVPDFRSHGLSFGARNSKLSACDSADSHVNSSCVGIEARGHPDCRRWSPQPPVSTEFARQKGGISK